MNMENFKSFTVSKYFADNVCHLCEYSFSIPGMLVEEFEESEEFNRFAEYVKQLNERKIERIVGKIHEV